ncbi:NepR family anti-sigma factor [Methylobacterium phyllostachyos]|nr:NepR family anti-sigma factor [Methylobacterium phyllostachyos]
MRPGAPHAIQHHLGRKLQGMYAHIPATPLPDRLNQLLAQLDAACAAD